MVNDNPAYQITVQRIELKENTAYHTVHPAVASPQYETIPQVGMLDKSPQCIKEKDSPDYEDVSNL